MILYSTGVSSSVCLRLSLVLTASIYNIYSSQIMIHIHKQKRANTWTEQNCANRAERDGPETWRTEQMLNTEGSTQHGEMGQRNAEKGQSVGQQSSWKRTRCSTHGPVGDVGEADGGSDAWTCQGGNWEYVLVESA